MLNSESVTFAASVPGRGIERRAAVLRAQVALREDERATVVGDAMRDRECRDPALRRDFDAGVVERAEIVDRDRAVDVAAMRARGQRGREEEAVRYAWTNLGE